ncbi:MAG TPA: nitrate- and nitrite sensing domain-containing protein, partial [Cryptosporangiaceae bacterium]|nr:nitrate- and nitrite sensing domain-containing protein [Cryptosporangiaceae bacterium]
MAAIVLAPVLALLLVAGIGANAQLASVARVQATERLVAVGPPLVALVSALQRERGVTAALLAGGQGHDAAVLDAPRGTVDAKVDDYRRSTAAVTDAPERLRSLVAAAGERLDTLPVVRDAIGDTALTHEAAFDAYSAVIESLLALIDEISRSTDDASVTQPLRALDALASATEFAAQQRGLIYALLSSPPRSDPDAVAAVVALIGRESDAVGAFRSEATPGQWRLWEETVRGSYVDQTERVQAAFLGRRDAAPGADPASPAGADPSRQSGRDAGPPVTDLSGQDWLAAATGKLDLMQRVQVRLLGEAVDASAAARAGAVTGGVLSGAAAALALLLAVTAMLVVASSLVRPLRALRAAAVDIAFRRLPREVDELNTDRPSSSRAGPRSAVAVTRPVEPIGINSRDEVGEVAVAVDDLHRQAVRLATDQAVLRGNLGDIFVNLSRRSQTLVERQLAMVTALEYDERDPARLRRLFDLEHLVSRMGRQNESLLVLAGNERARRVVEPASLREVFSAAVAQIEDEYRVDVHDDTAVDPALTGSLPGLWDGPARVYLAGQVVTDLVHLLAELLENATSFSSPTTRVRLAARLLPGDHGVVIDVADDGVGMSAALRAEANERLAAPATIDVAASPHLGLYVVGRLAARHHIGVHLRPSVTGGTLVLVHIPMHLLVDRPERLPVRQAALDGTAGHGTGWATNRRRTPALPAAPDRTEPVYVDAVVADATHDPAPYGVRTHGDATNGRPTNGHAAADSGADEPGAPDLGAD